MKRKFLLLAGLVGVVGTLTSPLILTRASVVSLRAEQLAHVYAGWNPNGSCSDPSACAIYLDGRSSCAPWPWTLFNSDTGISVSFHDHTVYFGIPCARYWAKVNPTSTNPVSCGYTETPIGAYDVDCLGNDGTGCDSGTDSPCYLLGTYYCVTSGDGEDGDDFSCDCSLNGLPERDYGEYDTCTIDDE
jgi:hypothetical protein